MFSVITFWVSHLVLVVKNPSANVEDTRDMGSIPGSGRSTGVSKWHSTPVFLPGKSHKEKCLVGHSPRGLKKVRQHCATEQSPFIH